MVKGVGVEVGYKWEAMALGGVWMNMQGFIPNVKRWSLHPFFAFCWLGGACGGKSESLDMNVPLIHMIKMLLNGIV